jgi:hypothetical protein
VHGRQGGRAGSARSRDGGQASRGQQRGPEGACVAADAETEADVFFLCRTLLARSSRASTAWRYGPNALPDASLIGPFFAD